MEDDLNTLYEWSAKWKMIFNPDPNKPAEKVIFSNKNSSSYETVSYAGVEVTRVDYRKHLGFILDGKMNYTIHIDSKIAKANQGIRVIQRLYNYLPRKALSQIYIISQCMMIFIVNTVLKELNLTRQILIMIFLEKLKLYNIMLRWLSQAVSVVPIEKDFTPSWV